MLPTFGNLVLMGKNTSVSLGPHFESFINEKVASGRYNSSSEVIRSALRLLEEEDRKIQMINRALEDGESSGMVENFDPEAFIIELQMKSR